MKKISFLLTIMFLCGFVCSAVAQNVTSTIIDRHKVSVTYRTLRNGIDVTHVTCDGKSLASLISSLEEARNTYKTKFEKKDAECKEIQKQIDSLQAILASQSQNQAPTQSHSSDSPKADTTVISLKRDKLNLEDQRDSLQRQVKLLNDSIRLLNAALEKVYSQQMITPQKTPIPTGTFQHVGAYYRIGSPWLFNSLLNQKQGSDKIWSRKVTFSHQIGVCWNSASFSDKLPMTYGVGLEYSRLKFSAGISNLKDVFDAIDIDGDHYTEYLTYNNVNEEATLRYLSIPLTFSIGAPRVDRISGYFQASLVTSFLLNKNENPASADGTYSRAGLYNHFNSDTTNTTLNLYLDDFAPLGFGSNKDVGSEKRKEAPLIGVVVSGRLSGGVYIPLCNTAKGETSQWALKVGVNLDMSISPVATQKGYVAPKAKYQLDQYNLLSGSGCWYINLGLEFGILYMFNK